MFRKWEASSVVPLSSGGLHKLDAPVNLRGAEQGLVSG